MSSISFFVKHKKKFIISENGCYLWIGAKSVHGYGNVRINKINYRCHRVAYEEKNGKIPDGLVLDHLCNNKNCINPKHLTAGLRKLIFSCNDSRAGILR